ncbi:integral membrane [Fusarium albosuccineum]|uniref:Integral membrane n=1 Tax=Fusarium albosuccineum TaxID=1237068 RepID=A0A8H4LR07_9HYPO|nr:integral membrane [Fusarium albosuccineum]
MGAVAVVFFAMRMAAKALSLYSWGADDVLIIVSFVFLISFLVIIQLMIPQGLGLDIWMLSGSQITAFLKYFFVLQTDYTLTLALIKASILCFFLRVFPDSKFRVAVWGTLVVNVLTGLIYVILNFFQRRPLSLMWDGWKDMPPRGVVLDLDKMALSHSFINIALDVWMLILPLTQLYKLGLKLKKKIGVIAMFSVGLFQTRDRYDTSHWAMIWSCIEVCVGVMVACMPHTRQLMMHLLSKRKARSTVDTNSGSEQVFINRSLERIFDLDSDGTTPAVSDKGGCCRPGRPARNDPVALSHVGDAGAKV